MDFRKNRNHFKLQGLNERDIHLKQKKSMHITFNKISVSNMEFKQKLKKMFAWILNVCPF